LETSDWLAQPVIHLADENYFLLIAREDAFAKIIAKMKSHCYCVLYASRFAERAIPVVQWTCSIEAEFNLQLFARAFGTNNVNNCSSIVGARVVRFSRALLTGTAILLQENVGHVDFVFIIGEIRAAIIRG